MPPFLYIGQFHEWTKMGTSNVEPHHRKRNRANYQRWDLAARISTSESRRDLLLLKARQDQHHHKSHYTPQPYPLDSPLSSDTGISAFMAATVPGNDFPTHQTPESTTDSGHPDPRPTSSPPVPTPPPPDVSMNIFSPALPLPSLTTSNSPGGTEQASPTSPAGRVEASSTRLPAGAIAGVVIGSLVLVGLIALAAFVFIRHKRKSHMAPSQEFLTAYPEVADLRSRSATPLAMGADSPFYRIQSSEGEEALYSQRVVTFSDKFPHR